MFTYGFTIKCNWKGYHGDIKELTQFIYDLFIEQTVLLINFENDSKGRLHAHGALETLEKLRYTDYKVEGWSIYLRRVYEMSGWYQYIQKDIQAHQEEAIEYYKNHYAFTD